MILTRYNRRLRARAAPCEDMAAVCDVVLQKDRGQAGAQTRRRDSVVLGATGTEPVRSFCHGGGGEAGDQHLRDVWGDSRCAAGLMAITRPSKCRRVVVLQDCVARPRPTQGPTLSMRPVLLRFRCFSLLETSTAYTAFATISISLSQKSSSVLESACAAIRHQPCAV